MKKNKLDIAKKLLSSGELVIFPTETVFGLGADATNDEAVKSIFKVKKRPRSNPIICHFKSIKQIEKYFILNKFEKKLGSKFWPGPLTIILKKKKNSKISKLVSNNSTLVGCRVPRNNLAKKLISLFGNIFAFRLKTKIKDLNMKEIFIIKDCFEVHNEVNDFFSKKKKEIKLIDSDEISEIKSSQSTLIIDKKFENKNGGQSNILKIARNIGSTKLIVLDSTNDGSYDLKKEMGGAYIKISYSFMDEVINEIIFQIIFTSERMASIFNEKTLFKSTNFINFFRVEGIASIVHCTDNF